MFPHGAAKESAYNTGDEMQVWSLVKILEEDKAAHSSTSGRKNFMDRVSLGHWKSQNGLNWL